MKKIFLFLLLSIAGQSLVGMEKKRKIEESEVFDFDLICEDAQLTALSFLEFSKLHKKRLVNKHFDKLIMTGLNNPSWTLLLVVPAPLQGTVTNHDGVTTVVFKKDRTYERAVFRHILASYKNLSTIKMRWTSVVDDPGKQKMTFGNWDNLMRSFIAISPYRSIPNEKAEQIKFLQLISDQSSMSESPNTLGTGITGLVERIGKKLPKLETLYLGLQMGPAFVDTEFSPQQAKDMLLSIANIKSDIKIIRASKYYARYYVPDTQKYNPFPVIFGVLFLVDKNRNIGQYILFTRDVSAKKCGVFNTQREKLDLTTKKTIEKEHHKIIVDGKALKKHFRKIGNGKLKCKKIYNK